MCADVLQMCANSNKLFTTIRLLNVQLVSAIRLRWMSNKIKRPTEIKITSSDSVKVLGIIVVGPLQRVRPRNGILGLGLVVVVLVVPLRSEFIGEL